MTAVQHSGIKGSNLQFWARAGPTDAENGRWEGKEMEGQTGGRNDGRTEAWTDAKGGKTGRGEKTWAIAFRRFFFFLNSAILLSSGCFPGAFVQTPTPVMDKIPGPMDATFLCSVGLGFGIRIGRSTTLPNATGMLYPPPAEPPPPLMYAPRP